MRSAQPNSRRSINLTLPASLIEEAKKLGVRNLKVLGDSELVIKQMLGEYRVKNETLRPLFLEAQRLLQNFPFVEIAHNLRGHNPWADALANLAMDKKREVTEADLPAGGVSEPAPKPEPLWYWCISTHFKAEELQEPGRMFFSL